MIFNYSCCFSVENDPGLGMKVYMRIPSMETTMNGHEWLRRGDPFLIPSKYLKTNTSLSCESQLTPPPNHRRARLEFRLLLAEVVQPGFCGVPGNQMPDAMQPGC